MQIEDFDYNLPKDLIAHQPVEPRDSSRLMVVERASGSIKHHKFHDLVDLLTPNDVLVFNESKVFPARLFGQKETGGKVEILLLKDLGDDVWECISKPGLNKSQVLELPGEGKARVLDRHLEGVSTIKFENLGNVREWLDKYGQTPLPPYVSNDLPEADIRERYQTVYAKVAGSAAAPTAGLHFTSELLEKLTRKGIQIENLTLHVGLGTFRPVTQGQIDSGNLHHEYYELASEVAERLTTAKKQGKRIIAVGTTSARVLESICDENMLLRAGAGETDIFIRTPYGFRFVDGLITNFHIPKSSLLMLICAFVSSPNTKVRFENFKLSLVGQAYEEAISKKYSFYSFGDATLLV